MPADANASLGARESAGMVLTTKAGLFRLQHLKNWINAHGPASLSQGNQRLYSPTSSYMELV